ncbi:MAG: hypothetical protein EOP49_15180 [Sphingobacteriales bacterium]|nr:MAG: hypothetical protein EOP49_15180 [Sphingobacteriales bacterium]
MSVRPGVTSDYYTYVIGKNEKGKPIRKYYSVEECLNMYRPDKRLVLTWYPVFNMTLEEVWATYGVSEAYLDAFRQEYTDDKTINEHWPFHPAYVMGNQRVSCMICVLGSKSDLKNGALHNPELHAEYASMELTSGIMFRKGFSITNILDKEGEPIASNQLDLF